MKLVDPSLGIVGMRVADDHIVREPRYVRHWKVSLEDTPTRILTVQFILQLDFARLQSLTKKQGSETLDKYRNCEIGDGVVLLFNATGPRRGTCLKYGSSHRSSVPLFFIRICLTVANRVTQTHDFCVI